MFGILFWDPSTRLGVIKNRFPHCRNRPVITVTIDFKALWPPLAIEVYFCWSNGGWGSGGSSIAIIQLCLP